MLRYKRENEVLTKSRERVRKYAEVYTPMWCVKAMCDMLGDSAPEAWSQLNRSFLDPTCGNGNFLDEILRRKLSLCHNPDDGLRALESIYGIDIQPDNIEETRERLLSIFRDRFGDVELSKAVEILEHQIVVADALVLMSLIEESESFEEAYVKYKTTSLTADEVKRRQMADLKKIRRK